MNLVIERQRILDREAYGVKTIRDWNRYRKEYDRQHPFQAIIRSVTLWAVAIILSIIAWAPLWVPIFQLVRSCINVSCM